MVLIEIFWSLFVKNQYLNNVLGDWSIKIGAGCLALLLLYIAIARLWGFCIKHSPALLPVSIAGNALAVWAIWFK